MSTLLWTTESWIKSINHVTKHRGLSNPKLVQAFKHFTKKLTPCISLFHNAQQKFYSVITKCSFFWDYCYHILKIQNIMKKSGIKNRNKEPGHQIGKLINMVHVSPNISMIIWLSMVNIPIKRQRLLKWSINKMHTNKFKRLEIMQFMLSDHNRTTWKSIIERVTENLKMQGK